MHQSRVNERSESNQRHLASLSTFEVQGAAGCAAAIARCSVRRHRASCSSLGLSVTMDLSKTSSATVARTGIWIDQNFEGGVKWVTGRRIWVTASRCMSRGVVKCMGSTGKTAGLNVSCIETFRNVAKLDLRNVAKLACQHHASRNVAKSQPFNHGVSEVNE